MVQQQTSERRKKSRSPSYPAIDLETAIARAQQLFEHEQRHYAPIGAIMQDWGYSPKSSGGMLSVAALKKFGLIEDQGSGERREARLTPLALKIVLDERPDSDERLAAIQEAALNPTIHAELWEEYDGSLPSNANLRYKLRAERGFTDSAANELIEEFRRTISFARLGETNSIAGTIPSTTPPQGKQQEFHPSTGTIVKDRWQQPSQNPPRDPNMRTIPLPLSAATWVTIEAPFPLSEEEWERMMDLLAALKPGLIIPSPDSFAGPVADQVESGAPTLTAEAQELLKKVDEGGVPAYITDNLRRIAYENDVAVESDTTPNQIIEGLQQRALDSA